MAELMMLNKEISAGKSSLIQQNSVYSSGKENRKTEDSGSAPLDFSKVLRASKEDGEKKEEVRTEKDDKKGSVENKKDENSGKVKKPDEKKTEEKKTESKKEASEDGKMATLLTENSFLIQRDQLKVELQAKTEEGEALSIAAVQESGEKLPEVLATEESSQPEIKELAAPATKAAAAETVLPKEEKAEEQETVFSAVITEKQPLQEEETTVKDEVETKSAKKSGERVARPDLKKEELAPEHAVKPESLFRKEPESSPVQKAEEPLRLYTKEESIPEDVAKFLGEQIDFSKGEIKIELEPRTLGQITVKVNFSAGKANLVILAENPKTLSLLQNGALDMARILEQKTGEVTKVVVHEETKGENLFQENPSHNNGENKDEAERRLREELEERRRGNTEGFIHRMRLGLSE